MGLKTTIYRARISLVKGVLDYEDKSSEALTSYMSKLINLDAVSTVIKSDYQWHFGDIEETDEYLYCKLGKIRKASGKMAYDKKKKKFVEVDGSDEDVFISHMLFDKKTHFFFFEVRPELGYRELIHSIVQTMKKSFNKEISIDILPSKIEISNILNRATKVTQARFILKPSNPDNSEDIRQMDELIRDIKAKRAMLDFLNEDGLAFKESKTFKSALSLSERGFGTFSLNYELSPGRMNSFHSKRRQLKDNIPKPRTESEWKTKLLELLLKTIELLDKHD